MRKRISLIFVLTIILKPFATYFITPFCDSDRFCIKDTFEEHLFSVFYHFEFYIIISAIITYFFWYFEYINFEKFAKIKINNHKMTLTKIKSFINQNKKNKFVLPSIILFFIIGILLMSPDIILSLLLLLGPYSFYWLRKNKNIKLSLDTFVFLVILGIISVFFYEATSRGFSAVDDWGDLLVYPLIFILFPSYTYFLSGILCYLFNRNKVSTKLIDKHARIWILFFSCVMIYGFFNAIK